MRLDTGLSQRRLAATAGIDHGHLSLIERGLREPSLAVLAAVADAFGGNLSIRLYPGTGPRLRDPIQARITEALVRILDPRWTRLLEVPVHRPARGVIDIVVHDQPAGVVVATEVQSELRRLEQQVRWSNEKAESLPSADFWRFVEGSPKIDRLLLLRSTRSNRRLAERFAETLRITYPASAIDAYRALSSPDVPWPGSALLWAEVDRDQAKILDHRPRSVSVGRPTWPR